MKASTIGGGAAALAALALSLTTLWPDGEQQPGDEPLAPEVVALLPDGGLTYVVSVMTSDGGFATRFTTPKCVRRWTGTPVNDCKRSFMGMGGMIEVDPGDLVRFAESQKVGTGCQPVACAVMVGDDPDLPEIDIAQNYPLVPDDSM